MTTNYVYCDFLYFQTASFLDQKNMANCPSQVPNLTSEEAAVQIKTAKPFIQEFTTCV